MADQKYAAVARELAITAQSMLARGAGHNFALKIQAALEAAHSAGRCEETDVFRLLFEDCDLACAEVPPGRGAALACRKDPCWQCSIRAALGVKL